MKGVNGSPHDYGEAPDTCPPGPCPRLCCRVLLPSRERLCPPRALVSLLRAYCVRGLCGCLQVHGRGDLGLLDALLHPEFNQGKPYIYLHVRTCRYL